jgi:hypothetical protein
MSKAAQKTPMRPWLLISIAIVASGAAAAYAPGTAAMLTVAIMAVLAFVVLPMAWAFQGLALWQKLMVTALAGFIVLSYGFANFTVPGTFIPVGHLLMFTALLLALPGQGWVVQQFMREPVVWWWGGLLALTLYHVVVELPRYGTYTIRDASMVVEGVFLFLGYLWASKAGSEHSFMKAMAVVFVLAAIHLLTSPYCSLLQAVSPMSGIFQPIPLWNCFSPPEFLATGLLFFWLVGRTAFGWPVALIWSLMLLGLFGLLMAQVRSTYVGLATALLTPLVLGISQGLSRRILQLLVGLLVFGMVTFFALALSGITLSGRLGAVDLDFFGVYLRSFTEDDVPGASTRDWRLAQWMNVVQTTAEQPTTLMMGQGFGVPLTDLINTRGIIVRQPHSIHVSIFGRLGLFGVIAWLLLLMSFFGRGYASLRSNQQAWGTLRYQAVAWLLLSHVVFIVSASFGTLIEFSDGAIPFYVLMGFTLRLIGRYGGLQAALNPWQNTPSRSP